MADSVGDGFPSTGAGIEKGHLLHDISDGITYQYVGGPVNSSSSWRVVFGNTSYAQLVNLTGAVPSDTNPFQVSFQVDDIRGMRVDQDNGSHIHIEERGLYCIVDGVQCDKTSGGGTAHFLDMWIRKNGVDIPNTGVRNTIIQLAETKVLVLNWVGELLVGDIITKWIAVNNAGVGLGLYTLTNTVGAVIPAGIFSIIKI